MKLLIDSWLDRYKQACHRIDQRSTSERFLLFFLVVATLWGLWYFVYCLPLLKRTQNGVINTQVITQEVLSMQSQIEALSKTIQSNVSEYLLPQGKMKTQLTELDQYVDSFRQQLILPSQMDTLLRSLLLQEKGLTLVDMKNLPDEPFLENAETMGLSNIQFYKQGLEINFRGDYFSTLNFLQKLGALKQGLYWDGLTYTVETYPQAIVSVKVYTLSAVKEDE